MTTCFECGILTTNPKFCSLSCSAKTSSRLNRPKQNRIVNCDQCAKPFNNMGTPEKRFCSRSCSATYNNRGRSRRRTKEAFCVCGIEMHTGKQYCSLICQKTQQRKTKIEDWLSGKWDGSNASGLPLFLKDYIKDQANNQCSICYWGELNPITGKCPLDVDHIDGDSMNNRPENLRAICPNCHALTPTYKSLNKNSTRTYRKKYYRAASEDATL